MDKLFARCHQLDEKLKQIMDFTQGGSLAGVRMSVSVALNMLPFPPVLPQEVEQLRLERMQIDEQLRQINQGHRPADRERGDRGERGGGYNNDGSNPASTVHVTRSYNGRGRGRRGYSTGYGSNTIIV